MPLDLNELEDAVLALPPEQRSYLMDRLQASLDALEEPEVPVEMERAWAELAERRYQAYLAGQVRAVPADEALARIRERRRA
jgi:putative addiction module component (TIGR02574 family)